MFRLGERPQPGWGGSRGRWGGGKRGSGGWEYESRRSHFRRKQRFPHPSFESPSLLLSCLVQMAAESNRIKYIPEDRPIDYHRRWYLPMVVVVPLIPLSFLSPKSRPSNSYFGHIDSHRIIYLFLPVLFITALYVAAEQRVYRKFIKAPCNWVEKENRRWPFARAPLRSALTEIILFRTLDDFTYRYVFTLAAMMTMPDITTRNWLLHFLANHYFPHGICEEKEEGGMQFPLYIYIKAVFQIAVGSKRFRKSCTLYYLKKFPCCEDHPLSAAPINPPRRSLSPCVWRIYQGFLVLSLSHRLFLFFRSPRFLPANVESTG